MRGGVNIESSFWHGEDQRGFKIPSTKPYLSTSNRAFENEDGFGIFWYFSAVFSMNSEPGQDEILISKNDGKNALIIKRENREGGDWVHEPQGQGMARISGRTTIRVIAVNSEENSIVEVLSVSREFTQQVGQTGPSKIIIPTKRCTILGENLNTGIEIHGNPDTKNPLPDKLYDSERFDAAIKAFSDYIS